MSEAGVKTYLHLHLFNLSATAPAGLDRSCRMTDFPKTESATRTYLSTMVCCWVDASPPFRYSAFPSR